MLSYETIFSRAIGRYNDPKELSLSESDLLELYTERLHKVIGDVRVRRLFSSLVLDDDEQSIDYVLNYSVDSDADDDFVINVLSIGMAIAWLEPQVNSVLFTSPFVGTDKEKSILNGHSNMINYLDTLKKEQYALIRDHGATYNSYIES